MRLQVSGLPPHIAQIIAGHRDLNVTTGDKAVYPEETIQAHLAFLAAAAGGPKADGRALTRRILRAGQAISLIFPGK